MNTINGKLFFAFLVLLASATALCAAGDAALPGEELRRVLALYDSTEPVANRPDVNFVHLLLEMPLNRLGMVVDYHDVNTRPLPDAQRYRGIVIWFTDNAMDDPTGYLTWVRQAVRGGTRIVIVEGLGADVTRRGVSAPAALISDVYLAFGLRRDVTMPPSINPFVIRYDDKKPERFGFETKERPGENSYTRYTPAAKDVDVWRTANRTDIKNSEGVAIAVSPRGGFIVQSGAALRESDQQGYRAKWDLDPFAFLAAALECEDTLRPDVTTAFGSRVAFSHIDADGYANMAQDLPGEPRTCTRVVLDEVLKKYPVPVTVGFIVGHLDPKALGSEAELKLARAIMAEPNVQPGCHGYAHPLDWEKKQVGLKIPGYKYDVRMETLGAIEFLEKEVLDGKRKVDVFQWTGDCEPGEDALKLLNDDDRLEINGGSTRYDSARKSITYIGRTPLRRSDCLLAPWTLCQFDCGAGCEVVFPCSRKASVWDLYDEPSDDGRDWTGALCRTRTDGSQRYQIAIDASVPWIEFRDPRRGLVVRRSAARLPAGQSYIDIRDAAPDVSPSRKGVRYSIYGDTANFMEIEAAGGCPAVIRPNAEMSVVVSTRFTRR